MTATIETATIATCVVCGKGQMVPTQGIKTVTTDDGVILEYAVEHDQCDNCGETEYTHDQSLGASRARAGVLRNHSGFLAPNEIREIRERYGLTQRQLEQIMGTGIKTAVRWENGTVCQSRAADLLLRLLAADARNLHLVASFSPDPVVAQQYALPAVDLQPLIYQEMINVEMAVRAPSRLRVAENAEREYGEHQDTGSFVIASAENADLALAA
jgi:putative zinc finger/helix-turn-helix YgiT family protein